jgi:hypothetical protein
MHSRLWLERLREELARHRLPPHYAKRLMQELSDHFHDLTEEKMNPEACVARLGEPGEVAQAVSYYRAGFLDRHRWLRAATFLALPFPLLIAGFALAMVLVVYTLDPIAALVRNTVYWLGGANLGPEIPWYGAFAFQLYFSSTIMVPAAGIAALYSILARWTHRHRQWALLAGTILAICSGLFAFELRLSMAPGESFVFFGLGTGFIHGRHNLLPALPIELVRPSVWQLFQFLMPLAVILAWDRHEKRVAGQPGGA